ncbi:hypothetical protein MIND_01179600 [Mycena indigotica]|uniref:Uncharacterized protein n=1 Tax=Mycena indigotica TaxID=2126181 RepID=A0A8H6S5J2_9AGAR|nr:uncharacterized protein MIND_01179600 [Mycena indigotica]KAF7292807.1 hypothetical protein MIND_01179600 [Mycena indigotica]
MQFGVLLSLVSLFALGTSATAIHARHGGYGTPPSPPKGSYPQPSGISGPWYGCPDTNKDSHGKVAELCDKPPHTGKSFGCTYRTGRGTGTHTCTYDAKSGECNGLYFYHISAVKSFAYT